MKSSFAPGDRAPWSARYMIMSRHRVPTGILRVSKRGNPLPPTPRPGERYQLWDTPLPTSNQSTLFE